MPERSSVSYSLMDERRLSLRQPRVDRAALSINVNERRIMSGIGGTRYHYE